MINQEIAPARPAAAGRPIELLAPAGGLEAGYAALHYGADAVYLGLPRFSARAGAANFSFDDLAAITGFAHSRAIRRRVYVAVNTLVQESELDGLVEDLAAVAALGVDAVIVQDLGVYRILRRYFPELRLHASTQMAIHNRPGVEQARAMGFARATLARELTLEELSDIAALPGIETEVFVHGALCYGYSGLCLYSSHMLGRSGNRGRCAYLCRGQYRRGAARGFFFSTKDLALPEFVPQLRRAGVAALKIEGRMKSPLYVAAVVNYYRRLLDGTLAAEKAAALAADIHTIFSRPWTNLFLPGRWNRSVIEPDFVGHRGYAVGQVEEIVRLRSGEARLRFHSSRPLEVHDGLQIDAPGLPRPYGFAVERLRVLDGAAGAPAVAGGPKGLVFEAPAGALVEVALPGDHPEIPKGAAVYCASSQEIKRRYRFAKPKEGLFRPRCPVVFEVAIRAEGVQAAAVIAGSASAGSVTVSAQIPGAFHAARDAGQMRAAVEEAFGKLGGTRFSASRIAVRNSPPCFVPVSTLNQLRRQLTDRLEARYQEDCAARAARVRAAVAGGLKAAWPPAVASPAFIRWRLQTDQPAVLDAFEDSDWQDVDEVVLEVPPDAAASFDAAAQRVAERIGAARLRLALPVIARRWEQAALQATIRRLAGAGRRRWQAANLGAWGLIRGAGGSRADLDIAADWPLYVLNHMAAEQILALGATGLTLSPEDDGANLQRLLAALGARAAVVVFQDTPLMISEIRALPPAGPGRRGARPPGEQALASSFGEQVRIISRHGRTVVINAKPFCLARHLPALVAAGARVLRADFMYRARPAGQVREIWRRLRAGKTIPGAQDGNFARGLA